MIDVLGEYQYQLGRFRGKSFRWLLENAPGYVGWLIGDIAKEKPDQKKSSPHQIQNQEALKVGKYLNTVTLAKISNDTNDLPCHDVGLSLMTLFAQ